MNKNTDKKNNIKEDEIKEEKHQVIYDDQVLFEEDYGICCFCNDKCNPCSQSCGRCSRGLIWLPSLSK